MKYNLYKSRPLTQSIAFLALLLILSSCKEQDVTFTFNSENEVSGRKYALNEVAPGLPENWDEYEYLVLEFLITTPQRFRIGFTTDFGYNELRIMNYTPKGWNRFVIPLKYFREAPAARQDLAATNNQPRNTGWIHLSGNRGPLQGVDSIGIRMLAPIGDPVFKLRSISLAKEDPGDLYLGDVPVVDALGQYNLGDWEGKVHSLEELQKAWEAEDRLPVERAQYRYSEFGGYLDARIDEGTGFFRTVKKDGRWWFVDPEGYLFLSHGVNVISPGGVGSVNRGEQRQNLYEVLPPDTLFRGTGVPATPSFSTWNLQRRYGENYWEESIENIFRRMDRWGLNTIANWSSSDVYDRNRRAFTLNLTNIGIEGELMGMADVYATGFDDMIDSVVKKTVEPYRNNPWLLGYFTFNEPSFIGREIRLCDLILSGRERPIKAALENHLAKGDTPESRKQFIHTTFRIFIETVDRALELHDPNHLTLGIRFGQGIDDDIVELCKDVFDVFSFNCYDVYPDKKMLDRFLELTNKPLFIGEFHFGTVDRGLAQSLVQVDSQEERGVAYRYYMERGFSHTGLIGASFFQWYDQDLTGRFDGENYNCGMLNVTDLPYPFMAEAISETSGRLFEIHSGAIEPVNRAPERARDHRTFPDLWNE